MKIAVFSAQPYDRRFLDEGRADDNLDLVYYTEPLSLQSTLLAQGCEAVCVFVNDVLDAAVLEALAQLGVRAVLLRCAGFNNLDTSAAARLGLFVARVPAYSPEAVAEHTLALILTLNRNTHRAHARIRDGNFALDGLLGSNLHGKTVGVVGLGKIGMAAARIFKGFGCRVLGCDPVPPAQFAGLGELVSLKALLPQADIVSLHCPLLEATHHMIDAEALRAMKPGAMLVNTSRGALIDTGAVIDALKARQLGALAIDVYEQESELFFHDHSDEIIGDDVFQRLLTFPNVLVTGHQGFFTIEAMREIAKTTFANLACHVAGTPCVNAVPGTVQDIATSIVSPSQAPISTKDKHMIKQVGPTRINEQHLSSCHCGAVVLRLHLPDGIVNPRRCDCSICRRKGAIVASVPLSAIEIVQGHDQLRLYEFNTRTAKHYFCSVCGIYTHHQRRSNPNEYGYNVGCLEGVNPFDLGEVATNDGVNHPADR